MLAAVQRTGPWALEIVRRCDRHHFVVFLLRFSNGCAVETLPASAQTLDRRTDAGLDQPQPQAGA